MKEKLNNWLNNFYLTNEVVNILEHIKGNSVSGDDYHLSRNCGFTIKGQFKNSPHILEQQVKAGNLEKNDRGRYCLTDKGKKYLEDFHHFFMLNIVGKFNMLFSKYLNPIAPFFISILALIISIISLWMKCHS